MNPPSPHPPRHKRVRRTVQQEASYIKLNRYHYSSQTRRIRWAEHLACTGECIHNPTTFWSNLRKRYYLADQGIDGRIVPTWLLKQMGVRMYTDFNWPGVRNGDILWIQGEPCGCLEAGYCPDERMSASKGEFRSLTSHSETVSVDISIFDPGTVIGK